MNTRRFNLRLPRPRHGDINVPLAAVESRVTTDFQSEAKKGDALRVLAAAIETCI